MELMRQKQLYDELVKKTQLLHELQSSVSIDIAVLDGIFYRLLHCCPIENVWEIWSMRNWPNAKIDWKMANAYLFLAVHIPLCMELYLVMGVGTFYFY